MIGMTEKEYRALPEISYSSIKDFDKNRLRFYKKYILQDPNVKEDIEENEAILLGSLVDCLLTGTQEEFDSKFASIDTPKKSGQLAEFADELWKQTKKFTVDGEVTEEFLDLAKTAFTAVKYNAKGEEVAFKGKELDKILELFDGSQEEMLYKERRAKAGFIVISLDELNKAERIKDQLINTDWTRAIIEGEGKVIKNQLKVQYSITSVPVKSMLDIVHVDHKEKTIQPYDLKISYLVNNFAYSYWKQKYYLQVAMYDAALKEWRTQVGFTDYTILPMKFIVGDSTCQSLPVIWECNNQNILEGYVGFTLSSGRKVKGLLDLVDEIKWCSENSIWTTPKEIYDNNGVMQIKPFESLESED
jgi:hypothetical protein